MAVFLAQPHLFDYLHVLLRHTIRNDDGTTATFEFDEMSAPNFERMVTKDVDGNLGFFDLELTGEDELLVSLVFSALGYRGFSTFGNFSTNTDNEVFSDATGMSSFSSSPGAPQNRVHQNRKDRQLSYVDPGRELQSNPGFIDIFFVECLRNVDPIFLEVTANSDGSNVPVAYERRSEGHYRASLSLQEANNVSEDIIDAVCSAISAVGLVCPFVISKFARHIQQEYLKQSHGQPLVFLGELVSVRLLQQVLLQPALGLWQHPQCSRPATLV